MFLIIEGEGELRFGDQRYPIRKHDVIACPPGGPDVAHQIINTGQTTMRYLALSTLAEVDACEYPDSQKILVVAGRRGEGGARMFRAENTVDYYDRERGWAKPVMTSRSPPARQAAATRTTALPKLRPSSL